MLTIQVSRNQWNPGIAELDGTSKHKYISRSKCVALSLASSGVIQDSIFLPLASLAKEQFDMQTTWILMRRRVTRRLTQSQAVLHSDNIFTNIELR